MPNTNIAQISKNALAEMATKHAKKQKQALHFKISSPETSPLDLSEPHANNYFLVIPCTPVEPPRPPPPLPLLLPSEAACGLITFWCAMCDTYSRED